MLSLYYNIKDATFAAQGDGVCDDRVAIKCAIDACAAAGGGTVFFPRGTYLCGNDGADPANPCSFLLDNVDNVRLLGCGMGGTVLKQSGSAGSGAFDLFRITGGSEATEFEGITFDQSGLTSPGTNQCHMINILEANIVKVIDCKFTGGVGNAGSYVHMGGSLGDTCSLIYVADCDMRDAGGPAIWIDGEVNTVWITENTLIQTGSESDVIYVNDSIGSTIQDLKILNNKSTSATGYAVRLISSDVLARVMVSANILLGFVVLDGVTKGQFQNNQVYGSVAGVAEPVLLVSNTTHVQVQNNIVSRASTCDSGLVCELDTCDRTQVQKNQWIQEVAETSIFHAVDCDTLQLSSNTVRNTDAGSATTVAYLIEAAASAIDNIQIVGEHITSDAGTWLYAVHVKSNSETIGVVQINPGLFANCNYGVYLDENGGGAGKFVQSNYLMIAGGVIDAVTAAYGISTTGIYIRIGANASTFGAQMIAGNGTPLGAVAARVGSTYLRLEGGAVTGGAVPTLYVKETLTTSSGWVAK